MRNYNLSAAEKKKERRICTKFKYHMSGDSKISSSRKSYIKAIFHSLKGGYSCQ